MCTIIFILLFFLAFSFKWTRNSSHLERKKEMKKERSGLNGDIRQEIEHFIPSKRASETSSRVTFSALNRIAMFCDFFGSNTLFSCSTGGRTDLLVGSFGIEFVELQPKRLSIISSFNLPKK